MLYNCIQIKIWKSKILEVARPLFCLTIYFKLYCINTNPKKMSFHDVSFNLLLLAYLTENLITSFLFKRNTMIRLMDLPGSGFVGGILHIHAGQPSVPFITVGIGNNGSSHRNLVHGLCTF